MRATNLTTLKNEEQPQQLSLTCPTSPITVNACLGYSLPVGTKKKYEETLMRYRYRHPP